MEQKELKINIPEGYEIDKEQSTFERIVFKKKEKEIKTWDDLIGVQKPIGSVYISSCSEIEKFIFPFTIKDKNTFVDERHAKSALAMAQISQLMPYYGGIITDEEWNDDNISKQVLIKCYNEIDFNRVYSHYRFLAFHTEEQREEFLKNNEQLIKDYLIIK